MKYLPKSTIGAAVALAYLLVVFFMLIVVVTGERNHGRTVLLDILAFFLTLPTSWAAFEITGYWDLQRQMNSAADLITAMSILGFCALINSAVIYLVFGFAGRGVRALLRKDVKVNLS